MLLKPLCDDGRIMRQPAQGDIVAGAEPPIPATNATQNITVTGAMLLLGTILRSNGAAMTDTLDSAANIIAAIQSATGGPLQPGTTFRVRWIGTTAFTITVQATANTGVTVNRGAIAASSGKEFLLTIVNGTPAQTYAMVTTNASAVLTGLTQDQAKTLSPGMIVTNAVAGLQGAKILSVQLPSGASPTSGGVTLDTNANASNAAPGVAVTFSPVIQLDGLLQGLS